MDLQRLIGVSAPMKELRDLLTRVLLRAVRGARPPAILIQGETGTGKGLVATLLHRASVRAQAPFVDVNCAAIPHALMESELFGHERGAFTDARRSKPGLFQTAHGGTLFLDEVGLLPIALQAKLLMAIEERAVRRLGGTEKEPVDAWVISATNSDLVQAMGEHRFREDLYHRLAVLTIRLPSLRERADDVLVLADHFLARACTDYGLPPLSLGHDARDCLRAYSWPGNVRELANVIERAALLGTGPRLSAASLGLETSGISAVAAIRPAEGLQEGISHRDSLRDHLRRVLRANGGNISRTAEALGMSRNTVRAHIRKFGLGLDGGGNLSEGVGHVQPVPSAARGVGDTASRPAAPNLPPTPIVARWSGLA